MTDTSAGDTPPANSAARYEQCKADLDRLEEIKNEKRTLSEEASRILKRLESQDGGGLNRGALAEVRRMLDLSPAAIAAREESRAELFDWLIRPKLDQAAEGEKAE